MDGHQLQTVVIEVVAAGDNTVADCMHLFEQSFEVLTSLQEYPNVQRLDMEAHELQ